MKKKLSFFVFFLLFCQTSCNVSTTKEEYIHNFDLYILNLKKEYFSYKKEDWIKAENEFVKYSETEYNKFSDELTAQEKIKINNLFGQYYAIKTKYEFNQLQSKVDGYIEKANGFINEITNEQ